MQSLRWYTRLLLALATLSLVATYFLPLWEIQLWAPQYPEGLNMKMWLNRITGDCDIINGVNHYIGMKAIKAEMFPEFKYMSFLVGGIIGIGFLPVALGRRRWLTVFVAALVLAAVAGMGDYWRWSHDYGTNLSPKAAISIPGMSYSPPIIGYKSILNFVAYSGPDLGGWIFIVVGVVAVALLGTEIWLDRRSLKK